MKEILFKPIGIIHTPFKEPKGTPIQSPRSRHAPGRIELLPELAEGLRDVGGFSHIVLLYAFHLTQGYELSVILFLDTVKRGVFATRAPRRPNAIGLSVVRLKSIEGTTINIEDVDMVDGTPLLDIKPYVSALEPGEECRVGWLEGKTDSMGDTHADDRFKG